MKFLYMLLRLYTKLFKLLVELCCWGFLVLGLCGGYGVGSFINNSFMNNQAGYMSLLCAIVGLAGAFITEVLIVAPLMILFTLDTRIKGIDKSLNGPNALN